MNRRGFVRMAFAGAAAGIVLPRQVLAEGMPGMAGGVYYTKDAPGRWSKKVAGHLPQIEAQKGAAGVTIQVVTPHEMKGFEHYIVKHTVLNQDFGFVNETMFDPNKDTTPLSRYELGAYSGRIYVLSMCNKHDVWLNAADV
ncbi:MAG: hypothetical protein KDG50_09755 [Chromatiales bacterium]|nr:hypothetical protein [Chromatiales bacterium]